MCWKVSTHTHLRLLIKKKRLVKIIYSLKFTAIFPKTQKLRAKALAGNHSDSVEGKQLSPAFLLKTPDLIEMKFSAENPKSNCDEIFNEEVYSRLNYC